MVRAIKEREDRRPGVYDQSIYVREKPVTMLEKEKAVATTVKRMLTEYGTFPDAANAGWQGRLQDMDRIPRIFTFRNDAYVLQESVVLLHFIREVLLGSDRVLLLSYHRYLHAADHVLSGRNA
ncbi:hypothetical protein Taro_035798 [Colocasia esculenta]|uniref:Uncharacterized protein n=1 Tax=Colocasia esculenta TaxID=4460 RepID=A0A843W1D3_COLES|nr:hypothetical protein [Colocasia esculenta]